MSYSNTTRDIGKIYQHGGGRVMVCQVDENGVPISGATFEDLGYIQDFELRDETPMDEIVDETGNVIKRVYGTRTVDITATLMQVSKSIIDFLNNTTGYLSNKYYAVYTLRTRPESAEGDAYQELIAGLCQIKPMINVKYPQPRLPIEISVLYNSSAITLSNSQTNGLFYLASPQYYTKATDTNFTIAIGKYYSWYEKDIT